MKHSKSNLFVTATALLALAFAINGPLARAESEKHEHEQGHKDDHDEDHDDAHSDAAEHGFQLSPEALKNFGIRTVNVQGAGPWTISSRSVVYSGEEINLYRLRDGFFKRIDFTTVRKSKNEITVTSKDLSSGDQIVLEGLGFLRVAELAAFGGVEHGHSH